MRKLGIGLVGFGETGKRYHEQRCLHGPNQQTITPSGCSCRGHSSHLGRIP